MKQIRGSACIGRDEFQDTKNIFSFDEILMMERAACGRFGGTQIGTQIGKEQMIVRRARILIAKKRTNDFPHESIGVASLSFYLVLSCVRLHRHER